MTATTDLINYTKIGKASDLTNWKDRLLYRFFEVLPGSLVWITLFLVVFLSFKAPVFIAVFIILFDIYWLIKTIYLTFYFSTAFKQVRKNMGINWLGELEKLHPENPHLENIDSWKCIRHLIILPAFREDLGVIEATFEGLVKTNYPKDKMIVVLTQEESAGRELNYRRAKAVTDKYGGIFFRLVVLEHPFGLAGELAGKGSNIAWAGRRIKKEIIDFLKIPYQQILVSSFDVDTVVFPEYFGRLTHAYLTSKNPQRVSFQPVPFYINNIWQAPAFARVVAFSSTFWYTVLQEKFEHATTFSSHSMPFRALVDADFWQSNVVSEDSRIFVQCFLRYNGDYHLQPLYYPVSMDANVAPTFWQTIVNVYKQQRRWAWGSESIPYSLFGFFKNKLIPLSQKITFAAVRIEDFWSWATNSLIIFILGWLPTLVGGPEFNRTVLSFNLPSLTSKIMVIASLGLVSMAIFSIMTLPPRLPNYGRFKYFWLAVQWLMFPAISIFLGAIPAIDAQTRLMLGKYLGFWATPKN